MALSRIRVGNRQRVCADLRADASHKALDLSAHPATAIQHGANALRRKVARWYRSPSDRADPCHGVIRNRAPRKRRGKTECVAHRAIRQTARTGWLTWLAILAVTASMTSPAWADDPPATVYRYDSRPPEDVFQNGFTAWGNNDNVLEHLTGRSCQVGSSNSAFVSTSSSRRYTEVYLEHRMQEAVEAERAGRGTGHFIGYIYEVRADNNFYNASSSYFEYVDTYGDNAGLSPRRRAGHLPERISGTPAHSARKYPQGNARLSQRHHRRNHDHGISEPSLRQPADSRQSQPLYIAKVHRVDRRHISAHGAGDGCLHGAAGRKP